jgi:hypothetical protein
MGIPLRGRDFRDAENKSESRVAIVNETFAKKFFNGQDPIGRRFNWHGPKDPFFEIIGVVPDGKYNSLGEDPKPAVYTPLYQDYSGAVTLVARTRSDPRQVLSVLRGEVQKLDPSISVYAAKTLKEHMGTSLFPARMAAIALGSFGVLALILAAVGIYGVMSHVVAGRTREIGLRIALGAQLSDVQKLILKQGMLLAAIGSFCGLLIAFGGASGQRLHARQPRSRPRTNYLQRLALRSNPAPLQGLDIHSMSGFGGHGGCLSIMSCQCNTFTRFGD